MFFMSRTWLKYLLVGLWISFTIALATWWYLFSMRQIEKLIQYAPTEHAHLLEQKTMIAWEGFTLFICLVSGAIFLAYLIFRDSRLNKRINAFFCTFTHEIRTPLASLRLQIESLVEDLDTTQHAELTRRINGDLERLSLQLDNALLFSSLRNSNSLLLESLTLNDLVSSLGDEEIAVELQKDGNIFADRRVMDIILKNLLQNAKVHGKASRVCLMAESGLNHLTKIDITDDGSGLSGSRKLLGKPFARQYTGSGTGIGLFLIENLVKAMGGKVQFPELETGFAIQILLPRAPQA